LCDRWLKLGHALTYVPGAVVHHANRLSFGSFTRQHFRYGRGAYQFHQERKEYISEPVRVEPFRFYRDLVLYAKQERMDSAGRVTALMALSQVLTIAGYFREAAWPAAPRRASQPRGGA
jgi:GT2 family glycosyltransferase